MTKKSFFCMLFPVVLAATAACSSESEPQLAGTWLQPVPGIESVMQGITLEADGSARSENMSTLCYESWTRPDEGVLILSGKSVGNGITIEFSDTLTLSRLTADTLVLAKGDYEMVYTRRLQ